jgi:hypothetical protein
LLAFASAPQIVYDSYYTVTRKLSVITLRFRAPLWNVNVSPANCDTATAAVVVDNTIVGLMIL